MSALHEQQKPPPRLSTKLTSHRTAVDNPKGVQVHEAAQDGVDHVLNFLFFQRFFVHLNQIYPRCEPTAGLRKGMMDR
jgi:hypothetical protein